MFEISKRISFEAAHTLAGRSVAAEGSRRIHGHSYGAEIYVRGMKEEESGMVVDVGYLEILLENVRSKLDHHFLDEVEGLGPPTLENLCLYIWQALIPHLKGLSRVRVFRETSGDSCSYSQEMDEPMEGRNQ